MIHLNEITNPSQKHEYHCFRYDVYKKTEVCGFLNNDSGIDVDRYDSNSIHFGWYVEGVLKGCIRFVRPIKAKNSLYAFSRLPKLERQKAVGLMNDCLGQGSPLVELSRICIAEEMRKPGILQQFSLAIIQKLIEHNIDHALFTVFQNKSHWKKYGCEILKGTGTWRCMTTGVPSWCMVYKRSNLSSSIWESLSNQFGLKPTA